MKATRIATLVRQGLAISVDPRADGNPEMLPPPQTAEQMAETFLELQGKGLVMRDDGIPATHEEALRIATELHATLTYHKELSIRLVANDRVISRYNAIAYAAVRGKFNVYRVSGIDETFQTLGKALEAAGV
jgi:hypothetical protein